MTGDSRRERRRARLPDDPREAERAARLLARSGTENRDDEGLATAPDATLHLDIAPNSDLSVTFTPQAD
ncbi:hypothetical protein ACPF8X_04790 [Streptomyces sp. G35A]